MHAAGIGRVCLIWCRLVPHDDEVGRGCMDVSHPIFFLKKKKYQYQKNFRLFFLVILFYFQRHNKQCLARCIKYMMIFI